jgi:ABC-type glycerol-3-phosphate transport system permease component
VRASNAASRSPSINRSAGDGSLHAVPDVADLLAHQHELQDQPEILSGFTLFPAEPTLHNYAVIFTDPSWYMGYINSLIYVVPQHGDLALWRLPAAYAFSRLPLSWATSTCSSGC